MDRLVTVDHKELTISYKPNQRCSSPTFKITNLMHTMHVAISLSLSNTSLLSLNPPLPFSIIPPLSSLSFSLSVSSSHSPTNSPGTSGDLSLTVLTALLPTGKAATTEHLVRIFSSPSRRHIFTDAVIPVFVVGFHYALSLISTTTTTTTTPSSTSLFRHAIASCTSPELSSLLLAATRTANLPFVSALLSAGANVNSRDADGTSPLSLAFASGRADLISTLFSTGHAQIDPSTDRFLHDAAESNRLDLIKTFVGSIGHRCLSFTDIAGRTPLHSAAGHGHTEIIGFCASAGGDPNCTDFNGWTPLHYAAAEGRLDAVEFLLDCAPFTKYAIDKDGKTPFKLAFEAGHFRLLDHLQLGDKLHHAAAHGDIGGLQSCLDKGVDVNLRDQNGWTALHRSVFKGRLESVKALLSYGARLDVVDNDGYTPLHCAVEAGHKAIVLYLINHGAHLNPKSFKGMCPLDIALLATSPSALVPLSSEK